MRRQKKKEILRKNRLNKNIVAAYLARLEPLNLVNPTSRPSSHPKSALPVIHPRSKSYPSLANPMRSLMGMKNERQLQ